MDLNLNLKLDNFTDAAHINCAIRYLNLNRSLAEKDKLIDQLLIKRMEDIRNDLIEAGIKGIEYITKERK